MGRRSSIDLLPPELREQIGHLRRKGRTIDEIKAALDAMDVDFSRSALGRHTLRLDQAAERIGASRAIAETLIDRFGTADGSDKAMRLNAELLHSQIFTLLTQTDEEGDAVSLDAKQVKALADSLRSLTTGLRTDQARQQELRAQLKRQAAEEAAEAAGEAMRQAGLSEDSVDAVRARLLGI